MLVLYCQLNENFFLLVMYFCNVVSDVGVSTFLVKSKELEML